MLYKVIDSNLTYAFLLLQEKDTKKILYGLDDIEDASDIIIVFLCHSLPKISF